MPRTRSVRASAVTCWLLAATVMAATVPAVGAAPGDLDPTFNGSGSVTTDFGGTFAGASSVIVQPDRKLVAVGTANVDGTERFAIARYNPNGGLDKTFGSGGKVTTDFGDPAAAKAAVMQSDGKLIVAGYVDAGGPLNIALARYNRNGTLDATFGSGGKVITDFSGASAAASGLALQADGKLVVAGNAGVGTGGRYHFAVIRYTANGTLDPAFGTGGKVTTNVSGNSDSATAVVVQPDGNVVAAGYAGGPDSAGFTLVRYRPDGVLDPAFGTDGVVITPFGATGGGEPTALALQSDGKLVAAGSAWNPGNPPGFGYGHTMFALARYNPDGGLDSAFGTGGQVTTDINGYYQYAKAVVVRPDGHIVVAGGDASRTPGFILAGYNSDGSIDNGFGTAGIVRDTGWGGTFANALALQPDGNIVAAGAALTGGRRMFGVARYRLTPDPLADLAVTIAGPAKAKKGQKLTETITVTNNGPHVASATFTEKLHDKMLFVSVSGAKCTTPKAGKIGTITCALPSVAPGATATITVVAKAKATGKMTNRVSVSAAGGPSDPVTANNQASHSVQVR